MLAINPAGGAHSCYSRRDGYFRLKGCLAVETLAVSVYFKPTKVGKSRMNQPNTPSQFETEIEKLESEEAAARVAVDVPSLEALWADELIINATENIVYTKDHFLLRIKSGQIRFKSFERKISRIAMKGDVVVTTGNESIAPANGPDAGKTVFCSFMNVWLRGGASWQLIGRQVAVIARASSSSGWIF